MDAMVYASSALLGFPAVAAVVQVHARLRDRRSEARIRERLRALGMTWPGGDRAAAAPGSNEPRPGLGHPAFGRRRPMLFTPALPSGRPSGSPREAMRA